MTQTDILNVLTVERYQPRYLTRPGEEIPELLSFDNFIAALRAEAKKPVPEARREYARPRSETVKWQNAEADEFIAKRVARQRELDKIRGVDPRRREKKKQEKPRVVELDQFDRVQLALSQGRSVKEALSHLEQRRK